MSDKSGEAEPAEFSETEVEEMLGGELTLTDVMSGKPVPFSVDGIRLAVRWPSPEEYDDAMAFQRLVRSRELRKPEVADLKDEPPTDETKATFRVFIAEAERQFRQAQDDAQRDYWNNQMAAYSRALEQSNLAEELADKRAALARDRWLTVRLLCHENGRRYFNLQAKDLEEKWRRFPQRAKEAIRPVLWRMLRSIETAPFSSEAPPE